MYCFGHLIDVAGVLARHLAKVLVDLERLHEADLSGFNQSIGYFLREKEEAILAHMFRCFYLCRLSRSPS